MDKSLTHEETRHIEQQAAWWRRRIETGLPRERRAFVAWLRRSPRHVRAVLVDTAFEVELEHVFADRVISVADVLKSIPANNVSTEAGRRRTL